MHQRGAASNIGAVCQETGDTVNVRAVQSQDAPVFSGDGYRGD
jgi:hypothetical protein